MHKRNETNFFIELDRIFTGIYFTVLPSYWWGDIFFYFKNSTIQKLYTPTEIFRHGGRETNFKNRSIKKKFIDSGPVLRLALEHYQKAQMAELADATDSKSVDLAVIRVRPPFWVLKNVRIISRAFFLWIESGSVRAQSRANPHFNLKPEIFIPRLLAPARFGALSA